MGVVNRILKKRKKKTRMDDILDLDEMLLDEKMKETFSKEPFEDEDDYPDEEFDEVYREEEMQRVRKDNSALRDKEARARKEKTVRSDKEPRVRKDSSARRQEYADRRERYDRGRDEYADYREVRERQPREREEYSRRRDRDEYARRRGPEDDRQGRNIGDAILDRLENLSFAEKAAAVGAVVILIGAVIMVTFFSGALGKAKQIGSFAEVGEDFEVSDVVGSLGLAAIADAQKNKGSAGELEAEEEQEPEEENKTVTVKMTLTSIKSDMKIKFINSETNNLVDSVPFAVTVETPDGTQVTYDDHDRDGIIYKNNLTAGVYKITPTALTEEDARYNIDLQTQSLTIKDKVEMKAVDVSNEIKTEAQVNVAEEDTAVQDVVESELKDTVENVESSKTPVSEEEHTEDTFEVIDKSFIVDPSDSSRLILGSVRKLAATSDGEIVIDMSAEEEKKEDKKEDEKKAESSSEDEEEDDDEEDDEEKSSDIDKIVVEEESGEGEKTEKTEKAEKKADTDSQKESEGSKASEKTEDTKKQEESGQTIVVEEGTASESHEGSTAPASESTKNDKKPSEEIVVVSHSIDVEPSSLKLGIGEEKKLSVSGPEQVKYSSDNEKVATVNGGTVKAIGIGKASIRISASGYDDVTVPVTVEAAKKDMTVKQTSLSISVGGSGNIEVSGPTSVSFSSDNESVALVDEKGKVSAVETGTANITLSAEGYNNAQVKVTVTDGVALEFKSNKVTVAQGKTVKLEPKDTSLKISYAAEKKEIASVSKDGTVTGVAVGETVIKASCEGYDTAQITVTVSKALAPLKDKDGNIVYVKDENGNYVEATAEDLKKEGVKFYIDKSDKSYKYTGWQTIDGKTYYYDKDGNYVTGEQVIQGAKYTFGSDGVLSTSSGTLGIDVSKWNGRIDWSKVKNSGINFAMIRCGYRGSTQGALIEDPQFKANIKGATDEGIRVGVYFFTQALNEVEAVEEASMVLDLIKGYDLSLPVYLDVEGSNGRGDTISASQRTANIKAFCGTVQGAGYKVGVYSNKTWFTGRMNVASLTNYNIWLAQYVASVTYTTSRYDMWQYTSKGTVSGISGNVDLDLLYNN